MWVNVCIYLSAPECKRCFVVGACLVSPRAAVVLTQENRCVLVVPSCYLYIDAASDIDGASLTVKSLTLPLLYAFARFARFAATFCCHLCRYNQLMRIEEELGDRAAYSGEKLRTPCAPY